MRTQQGQREVPTGPCFRSLGWQTVCLALAAALISCGVNQKVESLPSAPSTFGHATSIESIDGAILRIESGRLAVGLPTGRWGLSFDIVVERIYNDSIVVPCNCMKDVTTGTEYRAVRIGDSVLLLAYFDATWRGEVLAFRQFDAGWEVMRPVYNGRPRLSLHSFNHRFFIDTATRTICGCYKALDESASVDVDCWRIGADGYQFLGDQRIHVDSVEGAIPLASAQ